MKEIKKMSANLPGSDFWGESLNFSECIYIVPLIVVGIYKVYGVISIPHMQGVSYTQIYSARKQ